MSESNNSINVKVEERSKKNIKFGSVLGYSAFVLNILYGLFFTPWIASELKGDYGIYAISFSLITLFLVDFGLGTATNVFISKYRAEGNEKEITPFVNTTFKLFVLLSVLLSAVFAAAYFLIPVLYSNNELWTPEKISLLQNLFLITAIYSVLSFPFTILSGIISAYESFVWLKIVDILSKALHVFLSALVIVLLSKASLSAWNIYALIFTYIASGIFAILFRILIVKRRIGISISLKRKLDVPLSKRIFSYSIFAAIIAICSRLIFTICPIIIGATSSPNEAGLFSFISTIEGYIYIFGSVMSGFFIAKISRINSHTENKEEMFDITVHYGKIQLFFIALVVVEFISCGNEFCKMWMTKNPEYDYNKTYIGVLIICLYQLVFVPQSVLNSAMMTTKSNAKRLSLVYLIRALCNVAIATLLSIYFGALGACISIFIVRLISLIVENILYKRRLKFDVLLFFKKVFLPFLLPISLSLAVGLGLHFAFAFANISTLFAFCLIGFAAAFVYCLASFAIQPKEIKNTLLSKLKAKLITKNDGQTVAFADWFYRNKVQILRISSLSFAFVSLAICLFYGFSKNAGIAGKYSFVYKGETIQSFSMDLNNNLTFYTYENSYLNQTTSETKYKWNMDYSSLINKGLPTVPGFIYSHFSLQICDSEWHSYWHYYYVDGCFYSDVKYPELSDEQVVFRKVYP